MDNTERRIRKNLFNNNKEIKNLSVKINVKAGAQIIQQKGRPIPIHLQEGMAQKLKRLIKHGYVERATETTENRFVRPAATKVKKDKSLRIALDLRNLNEVTIKRKATLSANTDILRKLLKKQNEWIWTEEHTEALNKLKEGITKIQCLAPYNARSENIITTDARAKKDWEQPFGRSKKLVN